MLRNNLLPAHLAVSCRCYVQPNIRQRVGLFNTKQYCRQKLKCDKPIGAILPVRTNLFLEFY